MIRPIGKRMNRAWLALMIALGLLLSSQVTWANFTATVDRNQISEADILRLNLRLENQTSARQPDFSSLQNDFEILGISGPNQNTSISMVNGRSSRTSSTTWSLNLRPRRLGTLVIPAIGIANLQTQPIQISVVAQSAARKRQIDSYVFFETEVDRSEVYVQGELIYTLRLYYRENVNGTMSTPEIKNAIVETLEQEKRYDLISAGQRFFVLEKQYAIYPQSSGTLTIPRQAFSGSRVGRGFFSRSEPIMTQSDEHSIKVLPKPGAFSGGDWLPAKSLRLNQSWSESPPRFIVGEPINRTLTIEALGIAATMLPEFNDTNLSGAKIYPDPATDSQVATPQGLASIRSTTVGIVPTRAGTLILPAINISWWNTESNRLEIATIPESRFEVQAAAVPNKPELVPDISPIPQSSIGSNQIGAIDSTANLDGEVSKAWQYAAGAFLLLWLVTLYLYFYRPRNRSSITEQSAIDRPEQTDAKKLFAELKRACAKNDPHLSHKLLLRWMKLRFPDLGSIHRLGAADADPPNDEISNLERHLYSQDTQEQWLGANLSALLDRLNKHKPAKPDLQSLQASLVPA